MVIKTLSEELEADKFCVYCRAAPQFCRCNNEIKYAVWQETLIGIIKGFIKRRGEVIQAFLKKEISCAKMWIELDKLAGPELITKS